MIRSICVRRLVWLSRQRLTTCSVPSSLHQVAEPTRDAVGPLDLAGGKCEPLERATECLVVGAAVLLPLRLVAVADLLLFQISGFNQPGERLRRDRNRAGHAAVYLPFP